MYLDDPAAGAAFPMERKFDAESAERGLRAPQAAGERTWGSGPIRPSDRDFLVLHFVGGTQKVRRRPAPLLTVGHHIAHAGGDRVGLDDALGGGSAIGRVGVRNTKRTIVMKRLAAFVSQKLHALVANATQGLLLKNIGNKSYSHRFLKRTMSSDADRAALLPRA